jgi:hypothetical protein
MGCGIPAIIAGIVVTIAVAGAFAFLAGDDDEKCTTPTPKALGGTRIELIADCDEEPTTTSASGAGPGAATPVQAALPAGQVLYQGTSGGELGCITCDGQSRFISIEGSTTASGDAARAGQEIVWPEDGGVVDLGVRFSRPNRGRHGINLFVNGAYSAGCAMETGGSSCRVAAGQDPSVLKAGDRVTIIVGEAGTLDEDGVPVEQGDFVLEWWFVFQPD